MNYSDDLLVKPIKKSDTLSYKPFFQHFFYKLFYTYFYCLCLCEVKASVQKNSAVFYICLIWFGVAFGVTVLKILCFWCSNLGAYGNQNFTFFLIFTDSGKMKRFPQTPSCALIRRTCKIWEEINNIKNPCLSWNS